MDNPFVRFIDEKAVVTKANGDGGDSAQRTGSYYTALAWRYPAQIQVSKIAFEMALRALEIPNSLGKYARHWDKKHWFSQDCVMSRDNETPLKISMAVHGMKKRLFKSFLGWLSRFGFQYNTVRNGVHRNKKIHDASKFKHHTWLPGWKLPDHSINHLSIYIRGLELWPLYILLPFLDCQFVIDAYLKRLQAWSYKIAPKKLHWFHRKVTKSGDDINYILELLFAERHKTTPLVKWAIAVYKKRPHMQTFGREPKLVNYITTSGPQSAIQYYFSDGREMPIDLLLKPMVESW